MKNTFLHGLSLVLIFLATTGAHPARSVKLALNWKPEPQFGGFYTAEQNLHFKKSKLSVEILPGGAGAPVSQLVASGKVDFGVVTGDEIIVARARGLPLVAVFAVYQTFPQGIMTHNSRKLNSLEEVFSSAGTVSLQKGVPYVLFLEKKYAAKQKAKIVPYVGGIANFLKEKLFSQQCFVTSEPLAARRAGAEPKTFLISESGYNPYTTVVVTTQEKLNKNASLVWDFVKAVRMGWTDYLADSKATNLLMQKMNPSMDIETYELSANLQRPLISTQETESHGLGSMTAARWKTLASQLAEIGVIKSSEVLEPGEYFKNQP
jgi:NitT/TauT family transport system substrate-binding protein